MVKSKNTKILLEKKKKYTSMNKQTKNKLSKNDKQDF